MVWAQYGCGSYQVSIPLYRSVLSFLPLRLMDVINLRCRTLVQAYPAAGLGVSVATDGTLYQTDVFAASYSPSPIPTSSQSLSQTHLSSSASSSSSTRRGTSGKGSSQQQHTGWGDRPVLLLLGIRLGLDGVNPIYYEAIKASHLFP